MPGASASRGKGKFGTRSARGSFTRYPVEHAVWCGMWSRCYGDTSPDIRRVWRDRGITVCDRWRVFENFLADMGPRPSARHSIDRIDGFGNYEPGNVRWATRLQQARNRRPSHTWHFSPVDWQGRPRPKPRCHCRECSQKEE